MDDQFEPSVPKFKAPVAVRSEVAAVETERAKTKLRNATKERRAPSVAEKKMAKAAAKGRSTSAKARSGDEGRGASGRGRHETRPGGACQAFGCGEAQGITKRSSTTKGEIKQAAVPPPCWAGKSPTSTKVPMPVRRHVAQAASAKPKAR